MPLKIKKFRNLDEANHLLNGGIIGGELKNGGVDDLVGKAITFTSPAGTKTFTSSTTQYTGRLSFADIKTQLEAAIANLRVVMIDRRIAFRHASGTAVTLGAVNEGARALLGLPNNVAISGTTYNGPGGTNPKVSLMQPQGDTVFVLTEET